MPAKRYRVNLTQDEREQMLDIARRGKSWARKVKRSLILCKADDGLTDQQIADALLVSPSTVVRVRQRFAEEGLERALNERARPGKKPTWWQLHALLSPKGAPTGRCNCWLTRW